MPAANRRRAPPSPQELEDVANRQRARDALKRIAKVEKVLDRVSGPQLVVLADTLEWFSGYPTGSAT